MNELTIMPPSEAVPEGIKRADTLAIFADFQAQAENLKTTAETLTVTKADQKAEMKLARQTRLTLRGLRITIESKRRELGEFHLRETQKINGQAKALRDMIEPLEERLLLQEEFVERETARIEQSNREARTAELTPFLDGAPIVTDLGKLTAEDYAKLLQATKDAQSARLAREKFEREAAEKKAAEEAAERARIKSENERLRQEAIEREVAAKAERERMEAEAKAAREKAAAERKAAEDAARKEREALEAKAAEERRAAAAALKAEQDRARKEKESAEAKAQAEREAAAVKARKEREELEAKAKAERDAKAAALAAPDQEKLRALAYALRMVALPSMSTEAGKAVVTTIAGWKEKLAARIEAEASALAGSKQGGLL